MKKIIVAFISTAALLPAAFGALVHFDLSPSGSDVAIGLSPSNEVPPAINSTGSGNALALYFDTDSDVLSFSIGYGSAAGYTDLTGPVTGIHIHGPAAAGSNAPVLIDLGPYHFPAPNPALGGVVFGSIVIPTNLVADLLAGLDYVNIHTVDYPAGEIRGQLVTRPNPNRPPVLNCPPSMTRQCNGRPITLVTRVSDPDGDPLTLVWYLNGFPVQTNEVAAGGPPTVARVALTAEFPLGTNQIQIAVADHTGNLITCGTTVTIIDTVPPVIARATADPSILWPPNHKMVDVHLNVNVRDACGDTSWKIISVTSNEPVDGLGDGDTSPDWIIVGDHDLQLRAERSGTGHGRIYTIKLQAQDAAGNVSRPRLVYVLVPKSHGKSKN
jgi:CHRD domain